MTSNIELNPDFPPPIIPIRPNFSPEPTGNSMQSPYIDDTYGDSAIRLKTLEKEYNVLLKQYVEAKKNFIEALQADEKAENAYIIKNDSAIFQDRDTGKIFENVFTVENCRDLCIENKCDGADYIKESAYRYGQGGAFKDLCVLYRGNPRSGALNTYERKGVTSIIRKYSYYLDKMGDTIMRLLRLNRNILQAIEDVDPMYQQDIEAKKIRAQELFKNYEHLIKERDIVNQKMDEYSMLAQKYSDENINAGRQYGLVNAWGFVVFIIILFALREMFQVPISFTPIFILAIVFFLGLNLGVATGFLIWLGLIAFLIFIYFMNIP